MAPQLYSFNPLFSPLGMAFSKYQVSKPNGLVWELMSE